MLAQGGLVWPKKSKALIHFLVVLKERLLARDRLRSWGLLVPADCLLCGHAAKTTKHLFFDCQFSISVWNALLAFPFSLEDIVPWLTSCPVRKKIKAILKLVFQAGVYFIWRERNIPLHAGTHEPITQIVKEIQLHVRGKLLGLDRSGTNTTSSQRHSHESYISVWLDRFQA